MGFLVVDALARASNAVFEDRRYGFISSIRHKSRIFILLKPSTYMNLSGNAVAYWMRKEKIPVENLLVIVDDLSLPLGNFRMRSEGGDGGHNGLAHISTVLGTNKYARIRIGIGSDFESGRQTGYVLGNLNEEGKKTIEGILPIISDMILSFGTIGTELTMTRYNEKGKTAGQSEK